MTQLSCFKCMKRPVERLGEKCGTCQSIEWRKAEYQLNKTVHQARGKVTTEEVHATWRAPEWMAEIATQGGSLKELSWGWELRTADGSRRRLKGSD